MLNTTFAESRALDAKLFRGFPDPSRHATVEALGGGTKSASGVVQATALTESDMWPPGMPAGLQFGETGRSAIYELADARVEALLAGADETLSDTVEWVCLCVRYEADE